MADIHKSVSTMKNWTAPGPEDDPQLLAKEAMGNENFHQYLNKGSWILFVSSVY